MEFKRLLLCLFTVSLATGLLFGQVAAADSGWTDSNDDDEVGTAACTFDDGKGLYGIGIQSCGEGFDGGGGSGMTPCDILPCDGPDI